MPDIFARQFAKPLAPQTQIDYRTGSSGQIDDGPSQRFIERGISVAESRNASAIAECRIDR